MRAAPLLLLILAACPAEKTEAPPPAPDAAAEAAAPPPPPAPKAPEPPPLHEALSPEVRSAADTLSGWIKGGAGDPKNGWALAHGLLAFGPEMKATDGRLAIEVLVGDYAEQQLIRGRKVYVFPEIGPDGHTPLAPHRNMIVKKMLEAGVPLTKKFKLKSGATVSLDQLVSDAEWGFSVPTDDAGFRNYAWSVSAFYMARAKSRQVRTASGTIDFSSLFETTMGELEKETDFLRELMQAGRPDKLEKRRQGIYAHTCGGLHFVQAALLGASKLGDPRALARAREQVAIVLFRWEAERAIYADALKSSPQYRWPLLVQQLKFYGHVLETLSLAKEWGIIEPGGEMGRKARLVAGDLVDTVRDLGPAYGRQEAVRQTSEQTYYDLIGDGCHAVRGLRRALVAFLPG